MPLRYYLTFIDDEELPEAPSTLLRASSCEPARVVDRESEEEEEQELSEQVARLADRAALLTSSRLTSPASAAAAPIVPSPAPGPAPSAATVGIAMSPGSLPGSRGHPELCRRPCLHFFSRQGCQREADCVYCHLPHPQRAVSLDKRSRELVAALAPRSLLALLLPLLRARVEAMADGRGSAALCQRARAFVLALEQEAVQLGPPTPPECQKIVKRLKLMTFAMLMGLIVRCPAPSVALVAEEALEEMRRL
ncbi:unnamed protein product [Effrenium voratum]|uniref:C3H1-type domain-containing protein n=1 Tax=Effrenium voratum TaxID=2562239 RepID=A0AA36NI09_9DINO|nr:unnamed protein product [Effrenium voratum]CAJ1453801.1 unnamed protein product [Effrenium voratum]